MAEDGRRPWTQSRRFEFIEWKLFWEGQLNRIDLEDRFEISTPQASVDLRNYREAAGSNIEYNSTEKSYLPAPTMTPRFLKISADRLLLQLRAWLTGALPREDLWFKDIPQVDMAPDIIRHVDAEALRSILRAIKQREALELHYQSLTSSRRRKIAPHALAFDGFRWHIRAYCCENMEFRDFVITRISDIGKAEKAEFDPRDDALWNTRTTLRLCPHPKLSDEQSRAIQLDYNMTSGCLEIDVRLSMAYYFIRRMNLDLELPPARVQICLENATEVNEAIDQAASLTKKLVQARSRSKLA